MRFLIEPYNAYQKPAKKKHWMEIAEEEALQHRMLVEEQLREAMILEQAIHEAQAKQQQQLTSLNNQNIALPQYFPQPAQQQVQDGQYAAPAGGGPYVPVDFFTSHSEAAETAAFSVSPSSGVGPLAVSFTNLTLTPSNDTFYWDFGTGSIAPSTAITPTSKTYTNLGSYTVTLQETSSTGNMSVATNAITVVVPTLVPALVGTPITGSAPLTVTFTNNTVYNGSGTLTYLWDFGSGSLTSTAQNPSVTYANSGIFTVSLQVTESSYKIAAKGTRTNYISSST